MDIWYDILGNYGIEQEVFSLLANPHGDVNQRKTWTFIVPMDPWPLSEKVQKSLQIIIIPQSRFLRRYLDS